MQPKQEDSSDVTLVLKDGKEIRATRNELLESDFFSTLVNSNMRNREGIIRLEHISETVMRDVLEFMRCGRVKITSKNAEDLIEAADYFLVRSLKTIAWKFLDQELSPSNCVSIYYNAEKYHCEELALNSRKLIISSSFAAVAQSQEFLGLESQQVEQWICTDEIAVSTEDDVFRIVVEWVQQSESERKGNFQDLFRHVRLPFMSCDYLRRHVVTNDLVKENPSCLKLVEDALKGFYCASDDRQHSPRKYNDSHLVVFRGKETFCYQLDEDE